MEIAHDVATGGAQQVWLAIRTPPNIMERRGPAGLPNDVVALPLYHLPAAMADRIAKIARRRTFGDMSHLGLPTPTEGPFARAHRMHAAPTIVDREVVEAIRDGSVHVVDSVVALDNADIVLADGTRLTPDAVVSATGYARSLDGLVGHLGVFGSREDLRPAAWGAEEGLYFHGLESRPALIGHVARTSRRLARRIAAQLRGPTKQRQSVAIR